MTLYEGTTPLEGPGQVLSRTHDRPGPRRSSRRARTSPSFSMFPLNIPHYPEQAPGKFAEPFKEMKDRSGPENPTPPSCMRPITTSAGMVDQTRGTRASARIPSFIYMSDNGHSEETGITEYPGGQPQERTPEGTFLRSQRGRVHRQMDGAKGNFFRGRYPRPGYSEFSSPNSSRRNQFSNNHRDGLVAHSDGSLWD